MKLAEEICEEICPFYVSDEDVTLFEDRMAIFKYYDNKSDAHHS